MSRGARLFLILLLVLILLIVAALVAGYFVARRQFPTTSGTIQVPGLQSKVDVVRDGMGVPHLYASTPHDLFFAQGYVHAQDRFWQMEFWRRIGSGRLSEILGESALEDDKFIRTVGWHRTAQQELELLGEERELLQAYADGVNAYLSVNQGKLGLEFILLGLTGVDFQPEPWTPLNTLTWAKVMAWDLGGNLDDELLRSHLADALGSGALAVFYPDYPSDFPVIVTEPLRAATLDTVPSAAAGFLRVRPRPRCRQQQLGRLRQPHRHRHALSGE